MYSHSLCEFVVATRICFILFDSTQRSVSTTVFYTVEGSANVGKDNAHTFYKEIF